MILDNHTFAMRLKSPTFISHMACEQCVDRLFAMAHKQRGLVSSIMSAPCCNKPQSLAPMTTLGLPGASLESALTQGCLPVQAQQVVPPSWALAAAVGDRADAALQGYSSDMTLQPSVLAEQTQLQALPQLGQLQVPSVDGVTAQLMSPVAAAIGALPTAQMLQNPLYARTQYNLDQARCVGAAAARMNIPVAVQPSDTLALGVPATCGGPMGAYLGAGYCSPTNLAAAAVARAVYIRGTTACPNDCAQPGSCCNSFGCVPGPGACAARMSGLGDPYIPNFQSWVPPFPANATI